MISPIANAHREKMCLKKNPWLDDMNSATTS